MALCDLLAFIDGKITAKHVIDIDFHAGGEVFAQILGGRDLPQS
jgi:hypothetical protein